MPEDERHNKRILEAYKRCIECIEIDNYVRLGYVVYNELKYTDEKAPFYKKLAYKLTKDGEYKLTDIHKDPTDWIVTHDHNYSVSQNVKSNNKFNRGIAIFSACVTVFVTFLQIKSCQRDEERDSVQLQKEIKDSTIQLEKSKSDSQLFLELHQIMDVLKDTAKVKVKIYK